MMLKISAILPLSMEKSQIKPFHLASLLYERNSHVSLDW